MRTAIRSLCLALAAVTALAYINSFSNPLIFDDLVTVIDNASIRSLASSKVLHGPMQSATAGRPLVNLSFAVNYALGGTEPAGYRAVNLSLHILCGLLLFGIIRRTWLRAQGAPGETSLLPKPSSKSKSEKSIARAAAPLPTRDRPSEQDAMLAAFACALLWMLHPLHSETIDYVTQRSESMMALALFATLYSFIRGTESPAPRGWFLVAAVCGVLGALCKESMVVAPVIVLLYDLAFVSGSPRETVTRRWGLYAGLATTWIVLAALNVSGPRSHSAGFTSGISPWTYLLNQGPIILRYFRTALAPYGLVFDYGLPRPVTFGDVALPCAAVALFVLAALAAWRYSKTLGFLATTVFVALAPTSTFVPIATEVGAERRMYVPMAAIVVLIFLALRAVAGRMKVAAIAVTAVAICFGVLTARRNLDYRSPLQLWQTVVATYPHGRAHYEVAMALKARGRTAESVAEMQMASRDYPDAEYALGFEHADQKRYAEAIPYFQRYVVARPDDLNVLRAYNMLGLCQLALNRADAAAAAFGETLKRNTTNIDALGGRADALLRLQRFDEAIALYQEYVRLKADNPAAWLNYGLALAHQRRFADAATAFSRSAALAPNDPAAHANLADSLMQSGRFKDAIVEYQRVAQLDPDPDVRRDLQRIVAELSRR